MKAAEKMGESRKKILVGISGGASSAVTAALLKSQGYQVLGVHLQVFDAKAPEGARFASRCCLTKSASSAQEVCRKLDIPFHLVHAEELFADKVADAFVHDLLQARLPNACIPCNLDIRFGALLSKADELGCEQVATGHHAQIIRDAAGLGGDSSSRLMRAVNAQKDQSYFLFGLTQKQLSRLVFPLGGFQETMVVRLAREFGLPESSAGNPQAPCLSSGDTHLPYVEARVPAPLRPHGAIKSQEGGVMGEHHGLYAYRIGQKVKLAPHVKEQDKYQVIGFDVVGHALVIGNEKERFHSELRASRATWIRAIDGLHGLKSTARFSPAQKESLPCSVTHFENNLIRVELEQPFGGMIVGQAIVFYDGDEVVGGAYVDSIGALPKGE